MSSLQKFCVKINFVHMSEKLTLMNFERVSVPSTKLFDSVTNVTICVGHYTSATLLLLLYLITSPNLPHPTLYSHFFVLLVL